MRLERGFTPIREYEVFHTGFGRLARVGYTARIIDAGFSLSLFLRGRVPGDTAAAALLARQELYPGTGRPDTFQYHARVVHQERWIALQYWFLYPFNNWRSGFYGANDHEADWEMACVYLARNGGHDPQPVWAAYASHENEGDEIRRRWDDPQLEKVAECHPVIYVGAGSHAGYFQPGEYLTDIQLAFVAPLARLRDAVQKTWKELRGKKARVRNEYDPLFSVPFVDYARGDGLAIGPGGDHLWSEPIPLDPVPAWASQYRGLWGLYAEDPVSGENAPAGPMYNPDGTVRKSWYDPVGWAGLDKVLPPGESRAEVQKRITELERQNRKLTRKIERESKELQTLSLEVRAMQDQPHLAELHRNHRKRIKKLMAKLDRMRAEVSADEALIEALERYGNKLDKGYRPMATSHLRRDRIPMTKLDLRLGRLMEVWSAASIGAMLLVLVGLRLFAREYFFAGIGGMLLMMAFIEAGSRKRLVQLIHTLSVVLGLMAGLALVYEFFWVILEVLLIAAGVFLMIENLRELGD
jgi:hypothetical protein